MKFRPSKASPCLPDLLTAAAVAVFGCVVLPLQTYLANADEYAFSLANVVMETIVSAALVAGVAFALLRVSARWLRGWLTPLFVGLAVCLYLESGILSCDIPEINGEMPAALKSIGRNVLDLLVLVSVMAGAFVGYRHARGWMHWVAVAVLLLGLASLADVRRPAPAVPAGGQSAAQQNGNRAVSQDIVRFLEFSPTRNVLVFVIDSAAASVASELVSADAQLAAKFPGFVAYRSNIGMHGSTKHGVPGLMTGLYCEDHADVHAYMDSVLSPQSALETYRSSGAAIACVIDMLSFGYTTSAAAVAATAARADGDEGRLALLRPAKGFPYMSLLGVVNFRITPRVGKPSIVNERLHSRKFMARAGKSFIYDHNLYGALAERPVSEDARLLFAKFHVHGAHMPVLFDAEGQPTKAVSNDYPGYRQSVSNALVHFSRAVDDLRKKGVYDKSLILATTDHGSMSNVDAKGRHPQASALLWIKPEGAKGPWRDSDAPTSHVGIAAVLKAAAEKRLEGSEIERMLVSKDRVLKVRRSGTDCFDVYHYGANE